MRNILAGLFVVAGSIVAAGPMAEAKVQVGPLNQMAVDMEPQRRPHVQELELPPLLVLCDLGTDPHEFESFDVLTSLGPVGCAVPGRPDGARARYSPVHAKGHPPEDAPVR